MTGATATTRDARIDFFRGAALLVMCVDHAEEISRLQVLSYLTYAPVGVATGAEVFVFLSGVSLALACVPILERRGYLLVHARCLARAGQLYLLHVLALVVTVAVITRLPGLFGADPGTVALSTSIRTTNAMLGRFALMQANPTYFDILPLYIVLLLAVPPLFPLLRRSAAAGLAVSLAAYAAFHLARLTMGDDAVPFSRTMYYNPLAWQLLFVTGMAAGTQLRAGRSIPGLSGRRLAAAVAVLIVVALWYKGVRLNAMLGLFGDASRTVGESVPFDLPLIDKGTLGPLRFLHFLLLAAVIAAWCPREAGWLNAAWARPVLACGRNALEVFVFGVVFTYAAGVAMQALGGGRGLMLVLDVVGVTSSVGVAYLVAWRRSEPWRRNR